MITGIHAIFYAKHPDELQSFLRDLLFFAAPPTELAVHELEADDDRDHSLWLKCDDIASTVRQLESKGLTTTPVADSGWGLVTRVRLPGGDLIDLYEPRHLSPPVSSVVENR